MGGEGGGVLRQLFGGGEGGIGLCCVNKCVTLAAITILSLGNISLKLRRGYLQTGVFITTIGEYV